MESSESNQLDYYGYIFQALVILKRDSYYYSDFKLKIQLTPNDEIFELYRSELDLLKNKLLTDYPEFSDEILFAISDYRLYESQKEPQTGPLIPINEWRPESVNVFVKSYASFNPEYLNFDYKSFDLEKLMDNDPFWYENVEKYLPLPNIHNLIDCLVTISNFQEIFEFYNLLKGENQGGKLENIKQPLGFYSTLNDIQIERLFDQMQTYIDGNLNNFKAIFKNEPLPPGFIPIKRLKSFTVVLCAYFVSELFQRENPRDYWSIAENCFDVKNLKQSYNNAYQFNPTKKPKGHKNIDNILKNLYHPLQ